MFRLIKIRLKTLSLFILFQLLTAALSAQTLSLSTDLVSVGAAGQSKGAFSISSDTYWGIYDIPEWITLDTVWGNGDIRMELVAEQNPYTVSRAATITVYWIDSNWQYSDDVQLSVQQSASAEGINDSLINIGAANGSTAKLSLLSSTYWELVEMPAWLAASQKWGVGDADVVLTASKSLYTSPRDGIVKLRRMGDGAEYIYGSVRVHQQAGTVGLSAERIVLAETAVTSDQLMVYVSSAWSMTGVADWIKPSLSKHMGNALLTFRLAANPDMYYRADTLYINAENGTVYPFIIIQEPAQAEFSLTPPALNFSESLQAINIAVASNTNWGLVDIPDWIDSENIFGYGDDSFSLSYTDYVEGRADTITAYWFDEQGIYHQSNFLIGQGTDLTACEMHGHDFKVYPTAVKDRLHISSEADARIQSVALLNAKGERVYEILQSFDCITVAALAKGYYQLVIQTNKGAFTAGIVKL